MNNSDALNRVMDILQKQAPVGWSKTQLVAQVDARGAKGPPWFEQLADSWEAARA